MPQDDLNSYRQDFENATTQGGYFDLSDWGVIEIQGPDAADYLSRMSTVSFKPFDSARANHGAFLTGRGLVVSMGFLLRAGEGFHFIVSPGQAARVLEHIEQFHFAENFIPSDRTGEWATVGVWGPPPPLSDWSGLAPLLIVSKTWSGVSFEVWRDDTRPPLFWVKIRRDQLPPFIEALDHAGIGRLGQKLFDYFRVKAGVPKVGLEATAQDIILETGFDRAVARNKGCYPGQEVVERIFTYGSVNRKLMTVELRRADVAPLPEPPVALEADGRIAGQVVSWVEDPVFLGRAVGLAYIQKSFWERREPFSSIPGLEVSLTRA